MQILDLNLSHNNFYCPVTGHRISGPQLYDSSPALVGMWLGDMLEEPEIKDTKLENSYDDYLKQIDKENGMWDIDEFLGGFENPDFVVFKITTDGVGHYPTVWFAINMDYEKEENVSPSEVPPCEDILSVTSQLLMGQAFKKAFQDYLGANYDRVVENVKNGEYTEEPDLEEAFQESLIKCADTVFTFEWDGDSPLSNGSINIYHVDEHYVLLSTDLDEPMLFSSLDEALGIEYFHRPSPKPEISSNVLGLDQMLDVGKDLMDLDGTYWGTACSETDQSISINGKKYVAADGELKID